MRALLIGSALWIALVHGSEASPWAGPILTDRIYAVSTVNVESAKAVGVSYPRPIAVLGEKYTYIIGLGSDDIAKLANMARGKAILKDKKTLYMDGGRISGAIEYEIIGSYSVTFKVDGVAIRPAALNGVDLQADATIVNFYKGSAADQPSPLVNAAVAVLKGPLMAGTFLMWAVVDLTTVTIGKY